MMQQLMPRLIGYSVAFFNGEFCVYSHVYFSMKPVSKPAHADFGNILHALNVT